MEQMVMKSDSNGEILLYYVDENGGNEEGVITTIENIEQGQLQNLQHGSYITDDTNNFSDSVHTEDHFSYPDRWLDEEVKRLLVFYVDNKDTFLSGSTKKKHLWTVACKTMLTAKNPNACEKKLQNLKRQYSLIRIDDLKQKGDKSWPYYDLCHQAFHDDHLVKVVLDEYTKKQDANSSTSVLNQEDVVFLTKMVKPRIPVDQKVQRMLRLYLAHKKKAIKSYGQKQLWENIALAIGEEDADYWHKRFMNFKQHYIRILDKRKESGQESINWPYIDLFDEIFRNDADFQKRYVNPVTEPVTAVQNITENNEILSKIKKTDWDDTQKTVLIKYYFDCFDEFQDTSIPNSFLWNEVGRLLDKPRESCKRKFEKLRAMHLDEYIFGRYDISNRKPIAILFDIIVSKETELALSKMQPKQELLRSWQSEDVDDLVQFFYDNMEVFKNPSFHYVCYAAASRKLKKNVQSCRYQWDDLTALYKTILNDKKENPDMQIFWKYIDLFDRIFDYGMDTTFLEFNDKDKKNSAKRAKSVKVKQEDDITENDEDESEQEEYDEGGFVKQTRGIGNSKQFKILEFYQKNKDKFSTSRYKKQAQWDILAEQIGISSEKCAHRFRNLKQVYMAYIQREINKPEMPILWPYYSLCKKVFGYRVLKNKLKNSKNDSDDGEEWTPKEIKLLISHFSKNYSRFKEGNVDKNIWTPLSREIGKSESSCRDKLSELNKSYKKMKIMMTRNPECKLTWKYYKLIDAIHSREGEDGSQIEDMDVDSSDEAMSTHVKSEMQEEDDYQCIIVLPEGQELSDLNNAEVNKEVNQVVHQEVDQEVDQEVEQEVDQEVDKETSETPKDSNSTRIIWTKRMKRMLLKHFLNYVKFHKGAINSLPMWRKIAIKMGLPGTESTMKNKYITLRRIYNSVKPKKSASDPQIGALFAKIAAARPKLCKIPRIQDNVLIEKDIYEDVALPPWKVEAALKYYLEHIEEFNNPKYEKKYAWTELASTVSARATKLFQKLCYLKQAYAACDNVQFAELVKEIVEKEEQIKIAVANQPVPMSVDENLETSYVWLEEETKQLLNWYLENLDRFKNPKYVPSYLWMEASTALNKSALACSKKMSEIRTQYRTMVNDNPAALSSWRFYDLCQKIYGTGRKGTPVNSD